MKVQVTWEDRRLTVRSSTLPRALRRAMRLLGLAGALRAVTFVGRGRLRVQFGTAAVDVIILDRR